MKKINFGKFSLQFFNDLPDSEKRITIPTLFTVARILLIPLVIGCMVIGWWGYALIFFVCACFTDVVDGILARLLNEKTFLGACLDPVADKLLLISCFFVLACIDAPLFLMPRWFVLFVMSKEIIQIVGALFIYHVRGHLDVRPTLLGKITTCIQMIFIMWLCTCYFFVLMPIKTYYTMFGVMILFIGASFVQYVRIGLNMLKNVR